MRCQVKSGQVKRIGQHRTIETHGVHFRKKMAKRRTKKETTRRTKKETTRTTMKTKRNVHY